MWLGGPLTTLPLLQPPQSLPMAPEIVFSKPLFDLAERLVIPPPARCGEPNAISEAIGRLHGGRSGGGIMSGPSGPIGPDSHLHLWGDICIYIQIQIPPSLVLILHNRSLDNSVFKFNIIWGMFYTNINHSSI